ncbi:substrate-binding domain-containing protein [Vibrio mangrovi]|uniref:HTH-type transcriptional regulator GalR n=1 Tax=Vibrio mangrovi TaxID=474394 RepID=A0A1Y6IVF3_9VIBR|nr:substrate-binding domain-containing protein [Vibrio mangrovi]MDW6004700.1 substrate-binding domain-containing protein [Vibrio mangrovi]SMS00991.1 HTH-type transcriptional regulator GalR [Vibrio mangrovi]
MATIKDVAKEAGVSVATVSRVLNNTANANPETRASVQKAMQKLGYRPNANARALVSQTTNTIGVLIGDVSDPFYGSMVKAIDSIAIQHGKYLLIGNGYHNASFEREVLELLISSRCESLVVHSKALSNEELIEFAREVPSMVLINRYIPELAERCIALDNYRGSYQATEFLIKNGHRNIGYICSNHDIEDTVHRKQGYLDAMQANHLDVDENHIEYGSPTEKGGEEAMVNLLSKNLQLSAIACYNDYMAAGAMSVLDENGITIPGEISLIGFDDGIIAKYLRPKLTTIRYPIQMMTEKAVKLALKLANKEPIEDDIRVFVPTMVRRDSVIKR